MFCGLTSYVFQLLLAAAPATCQEITAELPPVSQTLRQLDRSD